MTNATLQILANRHNLQIDSRWTGHCREWLVKNTDGVHLFRTDDYDYLVKRLETGEGLRIGTTPTK